MPAPAIILQMPISKFAFFALETERPPVAVAGAEAMVRERRIISILCMALALVGIVLRLQRFILGRSFRNDEAGLALIIDKLSLWSVLSKPLGGALTAPPGFAASEKLLAILAGNQDYVFRLLPLIAGLVSVVLMYVLATKLVGNVGAVFCIGAFSLNWMSVFYASDFKQYSSDVLFALLIFLSAMRSFEAETLQNDLVLAGIGLVALASSHPAIFILASLGPVLLYCRRSQPQARNRIALIGIVWALAFLILYMLFYRSVGQVGFIVGYWEDLNALMPIPPWKDPSWFIVRADSFFTSVLGLSAMVLIPAAVYVVGLASFFRRGKWQWSIWLLGCVLATLLGSAIANYPFKGRVILFLVPAALLPIGEGIQGLASLVRLRGIAARALIWLTAAFLLWTPAAGIIYELQQPRSTPQPEDIKPALEFVRENAQPGDVMVIYHSKTTFAYYAPFYGLKDNPALYLPDNRKQPDKYHQIIDDLPKKQRIWFIFSRVLKAKGELNERDFILSYVRSGGEIIMQVSVANGLSSAHLVVLK